MRLDDAKGIVAWCCRKQKGIKIAERSENLCQAYLKKSNDALRAMNANRDIDLKEWAVEAAYYARYYASYALLRKCGISSEIHDCSIALISFLFYKKFGAKLIEQFENAKKQRIDLVYYTNRIVPEDEINENLNSSPSFVLEVEKIISEISDMEIEEACKILLEAINS